MGLVFRAKEQPEQLTYQVMHKVNNTQGGIMEEFI
jgi:hypothetical protein